MGVRIIPIEEHRITLVVWTGKVTSEDLLKVPAYVDETPHPMNFAWLNLVTATADFTDTALAAFAELKNRTMEAVERRGRPQDLIRTAVVIASKVNSPILGVWRTFVSNDPDYPSSPKLCADLDDACAWIGADSEAKRAVVALAKEFESRPQRGAVARRA